MSFIDERERIYKLYKMETNMTYSEFKRWSTTKCSREASLDRTPVQRNLRLLGKSRSDWNERDVIDARRTISFLSRMKEVPRGKVICYGLSKRDIALKNWAYDVRK